MKKVLKYLAGWTGLDDKLMNFDQLKDFDISKLDKIDTEKATKALSALGKAKEKYREAKNANRT